MGEMTEQRGVSGVERLSTNQDADPRESRVRVAHGVDLRVLRRRGAEPCFLLVHGLASNAHLWDDVAEHLSAGGYAVAAVDLRGHGGSSKPDSGYDFATIAEDLRCLVATLGLERPILVGQSWGANLVLETAIRHPELTCGIVLVDGGLDDLVERFPTWQTCRQQLAPPRLSGTAAVEIERYLRGAHPDWPESGIRATLANFEVRADGTVAPWLTEARHLAILRALWEQRPSRLLPSLQVPALVVPVDTGGSEWTAAKRQGVAAFEATSRRARVVWFSGDHDLHAQHPAALAALLLDAAADGFFG